MARASGRTFHGSRTTLVSEHFLELFHECFARYRTLKERKRLLAGIHADTRYGRLTVLNAAIFVCAVAACRKWPKNEARLRSYRDARKRFEYHLQSPARFYDILTVRKQSTLNEIKRIEALLALHLSLQAGYPTHSRVLWKCIERALCTDGLGDPSAEVVRSTEDVDDFFASVRLNLYNQRKKRPADDLSKEAKAVHRELRLKLNDKSLRHPKDDLLINSAHCTT